MSEPYEPSLIAGMDQALAKLGASLDLLIDGYRHHRCHDRQAGLPDFHTTAKMAVHFSEAGYEPEVHAMLTALAVRRLAEAPVPA